MTLRIDHEEDVLDQAIAWQQALGDDDNVDWEAYLDWLDADPVHRRVYDEVALLDRAIDEHAVALRTALGAELASLREPVETPSVEVRHAANDADHHTDSHSGRSRRWWIGSAIAAALAVVLAIPRMVVQADTVYTTAAGETRTVALGDGETVALSPASRLVARHGDPHQLELAQGEAYFAIAHDRSRTLNIKAGDFAVSDIGTRFGINLSGGDVTVAVAEGEVTMATAAGLSRQITAGQQQVGRAGMLMPLVKVAAADVGSWRFGRLVYNEAPLRIVVADLARFSGKRVSVEPSLGERPFSGVLGISNGSGTLQNLADVMAISYKADADGGRFVAGTDR